MKLFWIAFGGAAGTVARYLGGLAADRLLGSSFPFGTIAINAIGSFLMAIVAHAGLTKGVMSPDLRAVLATGALGGFTTYSTFNQETLNLLQRGAAPLALANLFGTLLLCLASGALGLVVARAWLSP